MKMEHLTNTTKQYASESSIHGIPYLCNLEHSRISRIWWMVFVTAALIATSFQVWSIWSESEDNPIVTTLETTSYPIEEIDFPAVTLCPQGSVGEIVDAALFHQFEEWLLEEMGKGETGKIKREVDPDPSNSLDNNSQTIQNLTMEKIPTYLSRFLTEVYPGAKDKPTKVVTMMNAADPMQTLENEAIFFEEEKCDETDGQDILSSVNQQLSNICPYPFHRKIDGTCLMLSKEELTYTQANTFCNDNGGANLHHLDTNTVHDFKDDYELVKGQNNLGMRNINIFLREINNASS